MRSDSPEIGTSARLLEFPGSTDRGSAATTPSAGRGSNGPDTIVHVVSEPVGLLKVAPIVSALKRRSAFRHIVVSTGGRDTTDALVDTPCDYVLAGVADTHADETARVLRALEPLLLAERPVAVLLAGDDDAAIASALAAAKLGIPVARLEAGLRSGDWSSPREINRVVVDRLSDVLFTHSPEGLANLIAEGIGEHQVHAAGNTLVDALRGCEPRARELAAWAPTGLHGGGYVLVALEPRSRKPAAPDPRALVAGIVELAVNAPVILCLDRSLREQLSEQGMLELARAGVSCVQPGNALEILSLQAGAGAIVTDSGDVQDVAAALGISCFTLGASTERPSTISHGTNVLLGADPQTLAAVRPSPFPPAPCAIPLWDGRAAERVADVLVTQYSLVPATAIGAT